MYADIFGTLPIAEALVAKSGYRDCSVIYDGVTVLSLPSLVMLKKVVKPRLLFTFWGL